MQPSSSDEGIGSLDAAALCEQGVTLIGEKQLDRALAVLSEAIRLKPEMVRAHFHRGVAHYRKVDYEEAVVDFSEAIRIAPEESWYFTWRGAAYLEQGYIDEAIADFSEAIRYGPDELYHLECRGYAFFQCEDYESAILDFSEVLRRNPSCVKTYVCRGDAFRRLGACAQALEDYAEAIRLDPKCAKAYRHRARLYLSEDKTDQALCDFSTTIQLDPGSSQSWTDRARAWVRLGEHEKALADFTEAIRLSPEAEWLYEERGRVSDMLGDTKNADLDFETANQLQSQQYEQSMNGRKTIHSLLQTHFEPESLEQLVITERRYPRRVRADVQRGLNTYLDPIVVHHSSGIRRDYCNRPMSFSEFVVRNLDHPYSPAPAQFDEVNIGEPEPIRCVANGLWLLESSGQRFAIMLEAGRSMRAQIATAATEAGASLTQEFFKHLENSVREARSYRGKILSLEVADDYSGSDCGIKVHKLHLVEREQVILPRQTLELLERNVIQFVRQRPRLAELGLSTRKGLLFYGPPGTGKTHTLHYLAGSLQGMTTLLITAGQIGLLSTYMTLARLLQPSMVVIEDADLIARERTSMADVCTELMLNELLNEMDGMKDNADVLFILTTNRPEALEAALTSRPGRIDQAIEFPFPDEEGRRKLVRLYGKGVQLTEDLIDEIARKTENVSAAFIKELMRRATQFHLEREGSGEVSIADVDNALEELLVRGGSLNRKLLGGRMGAAAT